MICQQTPDKHPTKDVVYRNLGEKMISNLLETNEHKKTEDNTVTNGLLFKYDYSDHGTGFSQWKDLSGNNNHGLMTGFNANSWRDDSLVFTSDCRVDTRIHQNRLPNSTIEAIVQYTSYRRYSAPIGPLNGDAGFGFGQIGTGTISQDKYFFIQALGGGSGGIIAYNKYYHMIMTFSNNNLKGYVDNVLKVNENFTVKYVPLNQNITLGIGELRGNLGWSGNFRYCAMYNRVLSPNEIAQNYQAHVANEYL